MASNNDIKGEAVIKFLKKCVIENDLPGDEKEEIRPFEDSLYFNFTDADDGRSAVITSKDTIRARYIDGSVLKQYTFTVVCYRSAAFVATYLEEEKDELLPDLNLENLNLMQKVQDWIELQADLQNYPDFGEDCVIESMVTLTSDPDVDGIDTSVEPPLARYSIGIRLRYLDNTKKLWKS